MLLMSTSNMHAVRRLRGPATAKHDGLNHPLQEYAEELEALLNKPFDTVVHDLQASGIVGPAYK